ncbi:MAG: glycosyltransferase family 39 protein [Candidatus Obscuribacterales bacterium]|nr:glycosyltransferase family 39 protein [Candidatus Obscuribacterales bacterium]
MPLLLFLVSLAVRLTYNLFWLEHRVAHYGDAFNFLRSGSALYSAIISSPNLTQFFHVLTTSQSAPGLLLSVKSAALTDRLLIDGPVYPAYLALCQWACAIDPYNPAYDVASQKLAICNSLIDSLACLLVYFSARLAFNKRTALLAGLLFAFYPPFIINTQHCYSEAFSYFLLSAWTALLLLTYLRHQSNNFKEKLNWLGLGIVSGLLMLSRPAFAILPFWIFIELALLAFLFKKKPPARAAVNLAIMAGGLTLILLPWLAFNQAATGKLTLFVNRVPAFNLFHGNQIKADGWLNYPYTGCVPGDMAGVINQLQQDAAAQPLLFAGMQFKKIARLWSGAWNDYQYSLFGIPFALQSLLQQIFLYFALIASGLSFFKIKNQAYSRSFFAAAILVGIVLFHFAYIPFEAISRYAVTAMPSVIILAAFAFTSIFESKKGVLKLGLLLLTATITFAELAQSATLSRMFASLLPTTFFALSPWLAWLTGSLLFISLTAAAVAIVLELIEQSRQRPATMMLCLPTFIAIVVLWFFTVQSPDWKEWQSELTLPSQTIEQTIELPARPSGIDENQHCFLLLDCQSENLSALKIKVNGKLLSDQAFPLAQLQTNNDEIIQCLALQCEGMGKDIRTLRHWWVVPIETASLRWKAENTVSISLKSAGHSISIFGDYIQNGEAQELPALKTYSYTKAFCTFDINDARVLEPLKVQGKTIGPSFNRNKEDLSLAGGRQYGKYRIRILVPTGSNNWNNEHFVVAQQIVPADKPWFVNGENPLSFCPLKEPIKLPSGLPSGTRYNFVYELKSGKNIPGQGFISLVFSGTDKQNKTVNWSSQWQPCSIPVTDQWQSHTVSDFVPARILALKNLHANLLFSPFLPDKLFLRKKAALRCSMQVRNACLLLTEPLHIPTAKEEPDWLIY